MQATLSKNLRRRGVVLTASGFEKLHQAKLGVEITLRSGKRYTLETLSEKTGLTVNTLSKVLGGVVGVDKQTLKCCFSAFNLTLEGCDYAYLDGQTQKRGELVPLGIIYSSLADYTPNLIPFKQNISSEDPREYLSAPVGQIPLNSPLYIERPPLESICYQEISKLGAQLLIKSPKQMGKSSLILRILNHANSLGYWTVYLSLQLADLELFATKKRFFQWLCGRISKALELPNLVASAWDNQIGCKSNATDYLADYVLKKLNCPLVIAIDEVNQLFTHSQLTGEFFSLLRSWSEMGKQNNEKSWQKLRFVTAFSANNFPKLVNDLCPSNTGLLLDLPRFTTNQVGELSRRYGLHFSEGEIEALMNLLEGHPYRVQLAFDQLHQGKISLKELLTG